MRAAPVHGIALAVVALALSGCTTTPAPRVSLAAVPVEQRARAEGNVRVFDRVWGLVADWHYDPKLQGVDWPAAGLKYGAEAAAAADDQALYASLGAMVGLLKDSHTHALSPTQTKERRTQTRARTGFYMTRVEGRWIVSELVAGSPAELAGVKTGWVVVARNGTAFGERSEARPKEGEVAQWEFWTIAISRWRWRSLRKAFDEAAAGGAGAGGWRRLSALRCVRHGGPSLAERSVENESRGAGCSDRSATQSWWWDDFAGYHHRRVF